MIDIREHGGAFSGGKLKIEGQTEIHGKFMENINKNETVIYKNTIDEVGKAAIPLGSLPSNSGMGATFSKDERYLAVSHIGTGALVLYKNNGDVFGVLDTLDVTPPSGSYDAVFSNSGDYLAVANYSSPYILVYKRIGDTFTKLPNPNVLPTNRVEAVAFSHDDRFLAVGTVVSPYIIIYRRDGDTFTKLANPSVLPGFVNSVDFSRDGVLAVGHIGTSRLNLYSLSSDDSAFALNYSTTSTPTGDVQSVAFSKNGEYLAVGHLTSPYFSVFKKAGSQFQKLANPTVLPPTNAASVTYSSENSNELLFVGGDSYISAYQQNGDTLVKLTIPITAPTGIVSDIEISPKNSYVAIATHTSPFLYAYKNDVSAKVYQASNDLDFLTSFNGDGAGISLENGLVGQTKKIIDIWR